MAQIQVLSQETPREELCSIPKSLIDANTRTTVIRGADGIWLYMPTSNSYDTDLSFYLGEDLDGAIATLSDLKDLISNNSVGTQFTLKRSESADCTVVVADALLNTQTKGTIRYVPDKLVFGADGYAGVADISASNIKKMISRLSALKKREEK